MANTRECVFCHEMPMTISIHEEKAEEITCITAYPGFPLFKEICSTIKNSSMAKQLKDPRNISKLEDQVYLCS